MKKAKTYENVVKRFYRPEIYTCPACHKSLKRAVTVSERIVVTFAEVIKMTHGGYRCLNPQCEARGRTYRSAAADALVLPRMTFGLDVVLWVGQLRLGKHQTLDEIHSSVRERLAPLGVSISRREVMYLFDAFCALLRAASLAKEDKEWRSEVAKNAGIIVSIDGIKPDGGNETMYLVRDALTGRLLNAENVRDNSVERLKQVLAPVVALGIPVLGTISDAQKEEVRALAELWPDVPHQTCQFHALREASRPGFEEDGKYLAQMREAMQSKIRSLRKQLSKQREHVSPAEAEQLNILDEYALGMQAALTLKGKLPFDYAAVAAAQALDEVATSLDELEKKGRKSGQVAKRKLARLKQIVENREMWREKIEQLKRMRQWVLEASHILDGSWAQILEQSEGGQPSAAKKCLTNKEVGVRFDAFLQEVAQEMTNEGMSQTERACLEEFLRVLHNVRPSLIQCYDIEAFPRTNNEMEGAIRKVKTRYRRISGRKNWNTYSTRGMDAMWPFMSGGMPIQSDGRHLRDWRRTSIKTIGSK